MKMMIYWSR